MITQELDLNMVPGTVPPVINVSQFDTGSRSFVFTLYNGATLFDGNVSSARIEGIKPDNKGFSYNATYSSGKVTANCTEQMTAVVGNVLCEIRLFNSQDDTLGTLNFILCVEKSPINEDTDFSETEIPALIDLARRNAEASAASAQESAASATASARSATRAANSATAAANSAAQAESIKVELQEHLDQIDTNTQNISVLRHDVDQHTQDISALQDHVDIENERQDTAITSLKKYIDQENTRQDNVISDLKSHVDSENNRQDELIEGLRTDLDEDVYKTDQVYKEVFRDGDGLLFVKQGFLKFRQGLLRALSKISVISEIQEENARQDGEISDLRTYVDAENARQDGEIADDIYKTDRIYENVFRDGISRLSVKQGILSFLQGSITALSKISVISELREDVDTNTSDIAVLKEDKLNRPEENPCGDLNQLLASNGNGLNSNKWVNLDDLLRNSEFIQQIIALIDSNQGILTVYQGRLTFIQGHLKVRTIT